MAERPPKFQLIDIKLGGDLGDRLATLRSDGQSFEAIAKLLWAETGISVTGATVSAWCTQVLSPAEPTEAAS